MHGHCDGQRLLLVAAGVARRNATGLDRVGPSQHAVGWDSTRRCRRSRSNRSDGGGRRREPVGRSARVGRRRESRLRLGSHRLVEPLPFRRREDQPDRRDGCRIRWTSLGVRILVVRIPLRRADRCGHHRERDPVPRDHRSGRHRGACRSRLFELRIPPHDRWPSTGLVHRGAPAPTDGTR